MSWSSKTSSVSYAQPGKHVRSREAALELPEIGRYVRGRRDARLLRLGRLCLHPERLPRLVDDQLELTACDPTHLERELHRLGHQISAGYRSAGLPVLLPGEDEHDRVAAIGFAAAAPLWQLALQHLAELDATFIALGLDDFAAWDRAIAAPISRWSARGRGAATAPSLRELTGQALAANRIALLAQLTHPARASANHDALLELWSGALALHDHGGDDLRRRVAELTGATTEEDGASGAGSAALTVVQAMLALSRLRDALATRRRELADLGAAIDRCAARASGAPPELRVALTLVARLATAHALVAGVADWLDDLAPLPSTRPTAIRIRAEAARVQEICAGLERWFVESRAAVRGLIGMEL